MFNNAFFVMHLNQCEEVKKNENVKKEMWENG